jgi:hypothetical protein
MVHRSGNDMRAEFHRNRAGGLENYHEVNGKEGKIRGTRRRGRRLKQLLDDLKEARRYWKLKEEAQDRTLWRTQFGRGYEPVAGQTATVDGSS